MKLTDILNPGFNAGEWEQKGYELPKFDIAAVRRKTHDAPTWVHFGGGNIFRAFPAAILEDALNTGKYDRGVVVAETFDYEVVDKAYRPYDNLSLLVSLKADGTVDKKVIASVTESLKADPQFDDWNRLVEIFRNPSLQMVSFTITEKGYAFNDADLARGLEPVFALGKVTALLYERFKAGRLPVTVQSMDNCSHNGDKVRTGVFAYADRWLADGLVPQEFVDYVHDESLITFPWSMIDNITPRPHAKVKEMLAADGFADNDYIETSRHTFTAPFVNSEETQYLVVEDHYTNGRPPLDLGGVIYTSRDIVDKVETMKVTTCLNPLHTAMAIFGYTGTVEVPFSIVEKEEEPEPVALEAGHVKLDKTEFTFDGKAVEPTVTVTVGDKILTRDTDYTLTFENNDKAGDAYAVVTAKEGSGYTGTVRAKFTIKEAPKAPAYTITKGDAAKWTLKSTKTLSFTASGDFDKFVGLSVDGKRISESQYTAKKGSTVITLKSSYLNTLKAGEHTITIHFEDGKAEGSFTVLAASSDGNPNTGDNIHLWAALLFVSLTGLAGAGYAACKKIWK